MAWDVGLDPASIAYRIAASTSPRLRVIAGPGTGKSFAMKRRVARLLEEGVDPARILPVTFTRVAAEDLHRELVGLGVPGSERLQGRTLHSLSLRILSRNNVLVATGRVPRPLNQFEIEPLIRDLPMRFGGLRDKRKRRSAYEAAWARLQHEQPGFAQSPEDIDFASELLNWLRFHHAMLIGEVIPNLYSYLRNNPDAQERAEFAHVLVDEFQDLNKAEQQVAELLGSAGAMCIVGDDDQSLYSFKHAHPEGIREWASTDQRRADETLIECRRCPTTVVSIANSLIRQNRMRADRQLVPLAANGPGRVELLQFRTLETESNGIAARIAALVAGGTPPGDIIVLAQRRAIGTPIFHALRALNVPVKSYYEETELDSVGAQHQLSLLKLVVNPDDRVALRWLLGCNRADFHTGAYTRVRSHCVNTGLSPWGVLEGIAAGNIQIPYTAPLVTRFNEIRRALGDLRATTNMQEFVNQLLPAAMADVELLAELAERLSAEAQTPKELLEAILGEIAQPEIPLDLTEVRVMSLHKSKGLSSPVVFIAGCIEGALPVPPPDGATVAEADAHLEEQRRLFFVGITRVKSDLARGKPGMLFLSCARQLELRVALAAGIKPSRQTGATAHMLASRFFDELGPEAPHPLAA